MCLFFLMPSLKACKTFLPNVLKFHADVFGVVYFHSLGSEHEVNSFLSEKSVPGFWRNFL